MAVSLATHDWQLPHSQPNKPSMDSPNAHHAPQQSQNNPRSANATSTPPPRHESPAPRQPQAAQSHQQPQQHSQDHQNGQYMSYGMPPPQQFQWSQSQGTPPVVQPGYAYAPGYAFFPNVQSQHMQPHYPAFDPQQQSQQFAQWAYQQMMIQQQQQVPPGMIPRQRTGSAPQHPPDQSGFYGVPPQLPHANSSPAGAPTYHPPSQSTGHHHSPSNSSRTTAATDQTATSQAFHPYRRTRGNNNNHSQSSAPSLSSNTDFPPLPSVQPPYARERNASASSVSSSSGNPSNNSRQRTTSNNSSSRPSQAAPGRVPTPALRSNSNTPSPSEPTSRSTPSSRASPAPSQSSAGTGKGNTTPPVNSKAAPAASASVSASASNAANSSPGRTARPASKPSPLSQQTNPSLSNANKRLSRDDTYLKDLIPDPTLSRSASPGGFKGRLRRALSLSASGSLEDGLKETNEPRLGSRRQVVQAKQLAEQQREREKLKQDRGTTPPPPSSTASTSTTVVTDEDTVTISDVPDPSIRSTKVKGKSRAGSLFNRKFNASTDNISLSSTVSSASLMIRKIGTVGALARRKSLSGITSLFKDKDKKDKSKKGDKAEAGISHVTVELDRGFGGVEDESMAGLTPAAKLARHHTLRANAEAAAKAQAAAAAAASQQQQSPSVPNAWERDTASRSADSPMRIRPHLPVGEDGRRMLGHEDIGAYSDDGSEDDGFGQADPSRFTTAEGDMYDEFDRDEEDDGDVTVRIGSMDLSDVEPWAVGVRRSIERTRVPSKGILKYAGTYSQDAVLARHQNSFTRSRANSYDTVGQQHHNNEPGPLAHLPSSDPDQIDGLQSSDSHSLHRTGSSKHNHPPSINLADISNLSESPIGSPSIEGKHVIGSPYSHPGMNSSAPTLSLMRPNEHVQRSATSPLQNKNISFAANLAVYDTFSAMVYDRRSEPATCNRLTPALAQRIKEELNSFKMEEMEVHAASRMHTQFFV